MNPATEIAPFFSPTTDPVLVRAATDILRQLRTASARNEVGVDARSALPAISALLACERYGQDIVSREAAQRSSACSRAVFTSSLSKCRRLVPTTPRPRDPPTNQSPSGRASMTLPSSRTAPKNTPPRPFAATMFDPLNLPGSSAKRTVAPVMRRSSARDLSGLVKNKPPPSTTSPEKSKPVVVVPETPTKPRQPPPPPRTTSNPPPSPKPTSTPRRPPTPRAKLTPTGHGSPMHNALMKTRLEGASVTRLAAGRRQAFGGERVFLEEAEEGADGDAGELPSLKRRRFASVDKTAITPKDITPSQTTHIPTDHPPPTHSSLRARPSIPARKINTLFHPLPHHPLDPHLPIPSPPLTFSGPTIFQRPAAPDRIFARMVPGDDRVSGDAYSLMSRRRVPHPDEGVALLEIEVHEVGDAYAKRERTRKRTLRRLERMSRGFGGWDREFGVGVGVDEVRDVPDWEERLDVYNAEIPDGTRRVIDGLSKRHAPEAGVELVVQDKEWIVRAETHGIAIRVYKE